LLCCYTAFERDTADQQDDRRWLVRRSGLLHAAARGFILRAGR
jgi:hypothetical protein